MEGSFIGHLAKVIAAASFPTIAQHVGSPQSAFPGSVDEFIVANSANSNVLRMLRNKVKRCRVCQKPNAFTLSRCNSCGDSLAEVDISFSPNVFMGFVFGIAKCPFPLTISIRRESPMHLVMDDLLALSPLHFNVVPTQHYIPDWRYLFGQKDAKESLALIRGMLQSCHEAAETFLSAPSWREKMVKAGSEPFVPAQHMACGFNFPPSQYQLHIQYIAPLMLPFQYAQFLRGVHFTYKRFFPFQYVEACLQHVIASGEQVPPSLVVDDASIENLIGYFAITYGVDYDMFHSCFMQSFSRNSTTFSNWKSVDFAGTVVSGPFGEKFIRHGGDGTALAIDDSVNVKAVVEEDKVALQNYGRPYHASTGKPQGSFYSFSKRVEEVTMWC